MGFPLKQPGRGAALGFTLRMQPAWWERSGGGWGVGRADAAPLVFGNPWPEARFPESLADGALTFRSEKPWQPGELCILLRF